MAERAAIVVGEWLVPTRGKSRPRWVMAKSPTHVIYGTGGTTHRECLIETLHKWIRKSNARAGSTVAREEL